ncbi:MAG: LON peptidase substrate-binding domain-containing protein [Dehalococcoidia bacterium]|nr:LON peptidase substrate-binding domain-containing protein [Dehalococcoidia bacterium]
MELPLFPLNSVLFPGATLPLHIFEERYKLMIGRCLQSGSPFGVLLIRSGNEVGEATEPFEVGTTARIVRVQHLDEGRMNLVCLGERRFRLLRKLRDTPYLVGEAEPLDSTDIEGEDVAELAETVAALFAEYYRIYLAVSNQWARQIGMPGGAAELADFVGSRLAVSPWTKQRLLEELSVRRRLDMELETLSDAIREMTPKVDAARAQRWRALGVMN